MVFDKPDFLEIRILRTVSSREMVGNDNPVIRFACLPASSALLTVGIHIHDIELECPGQDIQLCLDGILAAIRVVNRDEYRLVIDRLFCTALASCPFFS